MSWSKITWTVAAWSKESWVASLVVPMRVFEHIYELIWIYIASPQMFRQLIDSTASSDISKLRRFCHGVWGVHLKMYLREIRLFYQESSNECEVITIRLETTFDINRQNGWILISWRVPPVYSLWASDCAQTNIHKESQSKISHLHWEEIKNNQRNECTALESDPRILAAIPLNQNKNETKRRKWS